MRILGISEGSHDACWALIENGRILEAHHAERHSRIKNDKWLNPDLLPEADVIVGHQFLDKVNERRKWAGQKPMKRNIIPDVEYNHHETHAWAGWATAPFDDCDILTMDAVGEWDTSTVHEVRNGNWKKTFGMKFPKSYGMPYSHVTSLLGYKPMQDEYITMAMAAYGARYDIPKVEVPGGRPPPDNKFVLQKFHRHNLSPLFQGSCDSGTHYIFQPRYQKDHVKDHKGSKQEKRNLARNIQEHYEFYFLMLIEKYCHHKNLIIMGGCALNCVANTKVEGKNIWIMPNPGDGAALPRISALGGSHISTLHQRAKSQRLHHLPPGFHQRPEKLATPQATRSAKQLPAMPQFCPQARTLSSGPQDQPRRGWQGDGHKLLPVPPGQKLSHFDRRPRLSYRSA